MIQFLLALLILSSSTWAYQSSLNEYSKPLRWGTQSTTITRVNNGEGLVPGQVDNALNFSLSQWNETQAFQVSQINLSSNNELKFDANFSYGSGILAVTEVSYGVSGTINSAKIILNDKDFDFTIDSFNYSKVYLPTVLTHELGHFLGLSHSEVLDASMFYSFFRGQETISSDDISGLRSKYKKTNFGRIHGYVKGGNQVGVLGSHVQAISSKTGQIVSTISNEEGFFELAGLNLNDNYYLFTSPLKNINSLPLYFSNTQDNFCPGIYRGGFFSACGADNEGIAQAIHLSSTSMSSDVGTVSINCSLKNQLAYQLEKVKPAAQRERILIFDSTHSNETQVAYVGHIRSNEIETEIFKKIDKFSLDLTAVDPSHKVKIQLISKPFGNPLSYSLQITNAASSVTTLTSSFLSPETLDLSHWLSLSANSSENYFEIDLSAKNIQTSMMSYIPSSSTFTTTSPWPYLLIVSLWDASSGHYLPVNTESSLSDNKSCLDAPFTVAVKKSSFSDALGNEEQPRLEAGATCGTIDPPDGPSNSLGLLIFGLAISSLIFNCFKKTKNFLS